MNWEHASIIYMKTKKTHRLENICKDTIINPILVLRGRLLIILHNLRSLQNLFKFNYLQYCDVSSFEEDFVEHKIDEMKDERVVKENTAD